MAASIRFFMSISQTISHHHSSSSLSNASTLYTPFYCKSVPKIILISSLDNHAPHTSKFCPNCAVSSEVGKEVEDEGLDLSGTEEPNFPPELKLFVGNLPFSIDSAELKLFRKAGNVEMVEVIYDKFSGRSRGFGFVTMYTVEEAEAAAQQFNGYELLGEL